MTDITKENEHTWYKAALGGNAPALFLNDIHSGWYRWKRKDAPAVGVVIWRDWANGGFLKCSYDLKTFNCHETDNPHNFQRLLENFPFISKGPVTPSIFKLYHQSGCTKWPDESDAGAETRAAVQAVKQGQPAPETTFKHLPNTIEGLQERLDKFKPQAEALIAKGEATDSITADIAADLKNVLSGLETTATAKRKEEKKPHWDAGLAVDAKWNPIVTAAETLKTNLARVVLAPYQAKEQARIDQEQADKVAEARANNAPVTAAMTTPQRVSSGTVGRKVTPRKVASAKITDDRVFINFLIGNDKIHPRILAVMQEIADAGASTDPDKCVQYPGVTYEHTTSSV